MATTIRIETRIESTPYKGLFSLVNYDANNLGTRPHRRAVHCHIQNQYRKWKHQERLKSLRASINIPSSQEIGVTDSVPEPPNHIVSYLIQDSGNWHSCACIGTHRTR